MRLGMFLHPVMIPDSGSSGAAYPTGGEFGMSEVDPPEGGGGEPGGGGPEPGAGGRPQPGAGGQEPQPGGQGGEPQPGQAGQLIGGKFKTPGAALKSYRQLIAEMGYDDDSDEFITPDGQIDVQTLLTAYQELETEFNESRGAGRDLSRVDTAALIAMQQDTLAQLQALMGQPGGVPQLNQVPAQQYGPAPSYGRQAPPENLPQPVTVTSQMFGDPEEVYGRLVTDPAGLIIEIVNEVINKQHAPELGMALRQHILTPFMSFQQRAALEKKLARQLESYKSRFKGQGKDLNDLADKISAYFDQFPQLAYMEGDPQRGIPSGFDLVLQLVNIDEEIAKRTRTRSKRGAFRMAPGGGNRPRGGRQPMSEADRVRAELRGTTGGQRRKQIFDD